VAGRAAEVGNTQVLWIRVAARGAKIGGRRTLHRDYRSGRHRISAAITLLACPSNAPVRLVDPISFRQRLAGTDNSAMIVNRLPIIACRMTVDGLSPSVRNRATSPQNDVSL
jgi:hypothetical protein